MDLIAWVMVRTLDRFGGPRDGRFNAACFALAWREVTGLQGRLDGRAVRAMLHGRRDVVPLAGGAHFRFTEAAGEQT